MHALIATALATSSEEEDFGLFSPPHLKLAQSILCDVNERTTKTKYCHANILENEGYFFNCYGFVAHIIATTHEDAFKELIYLMKVLDESGIPTSLDPEKPSPYNFFYIFKHLYLRELPSQHWEGIEDIFNLKKGDILVYMNPGYVSPLQWDKGDLSNSSGTHVMVVSEIISKSPDVLDIKIIDSTHKPHNQTNDTRHLHKITSGIGECCVQLLKASGENAYCLLWSTKTIWIKDFYAGRIKKPITS